MRTAHSSSACEGWREWETAQKFDKLAVWPAYFDTVLTLSGTMVVFSRYTRFRGDEIGSQCILCAGSYLPDNMFAPKTRLSNGSLSLSLSLSLPLSLSLRTRAFVTCV